MITPLRVPAPFRAPVPARGPRITARTSVMTAYALEVSEDDPSDGEGRPPFVTTRTIEVVGG